MSKDREPEELTDQESAKESLLTGGERVSKGQQRNRKYENTPGQHALDFVLGTSIIVLIGTLAIPNLRYEWLAVAPLIVGIVAGILIALHRRLG